MARRVAVPPAGGPQGARTLDATNLDRPASRRRGAAAGRPVAEQDEWRRVRATGTYLADQNIIVRYQTRDGASGVDVVTPLDTGAGAPRCWSTGAGCRPRTPATRSRRPAPPGARSRSSRLGARRRDGDSTAVDRRLHPGHLEPAIGEALDTEVYGGFVDVTTESPEPAVAAGARRGAGPVRGAALLLRAPVVVLRALALFGFGYLAWDECSQAAHRATSAPADEPVDGAVAR